MKPREGRQRVSRQIVTPTIIVFLQYELDRAFQTGPAERTHSFKVAP